jgi:hypothetical protein
MPVRAKKTTKSPRSVRYLLSADRRLQKLSLRKISERLKESAHPTRSVRSKHSADAKVAVRPPWAMGWRAVVLGVIGVVGAAVLITAGQPSRRGEVASVASAQDAAPLLESAPVPARLETGKTVASNAPTMAAVPRTPAADGSTTKVRAIEPVKAQAVDPAGKTAAAVEPAEKTRPVESATNPPASEPAPTAAQNDVLNAAPVTITGCLELAGDTFRLKDTSGAEAPKARSWRSGFLKKRTSQIVLVDATSMLNLSNYVGQRVAATGTLENREMRTRSVRRVAAFCN